MFEKIRQFFEEAQAEFRHVNWPTRNEAIRLTLVVVVLSLILAFFLGVFDYSFVAGLNYLIKTFVVGS